MTDGQIKKVKVINTFDGTEIIVYASNQLDLSVQLREKKLLTKESTVSIDDQVKDKDYDWIAKIIYDEPD